MATQWLGAIPPPEGITPNYIDPPSQHNRNIALHTVCLTLITFAVVMRVYTRVFVVRASFGTDDWLCILSYPFTIVFSSLMLKTFTGGIGRHMWDTPAEWIPTTFKYFAFAEYTYLVLTALVKLSFLFFYYRIFSSRNSSRHLITLGITFVVCANTAVLLAVIFSCIPVARAWNAGLPGHCMDPMILPYLAGAVSSATDIYVLALPIYPVWRLNTRAGRKVKILTVFGLGILCSLLLPAFLDCHWPKTLGSSLDRLWPSTASRQKKQNQYEDPSQSHQPSWPGQKPADDDSVEHDYFELGSTDHIYKAQNVGEPVSKHAFS